MGKQAIYGANAKFFLPPTPFGDDLTAIDALKKFKSFKQFSVNPSDIVISNDSGLAVLFPKGDRGSDGYLFEYYPSGESVRMVGKLAQEEVKELGIGDAMRNRAHNRASKNSILGL